MALDKSRSKITKLVENVQRWNIECAEVYSFDAAKSLDQNAGTHHCLCCHSTFHSSLNASIAFSALTLLVGCQEGHPALDASLGVFWTPDPT